MNDKNIIETEDASKMIHPKGIREHTDGREFRPYLLLGATLIIAVVLAAICYGIQLYFIGPG